MIKVQSKAFVSNLFSFVFLTFVITSVIIYVKKYLILIG